MQRSAILLLGLVLAVAPAAQAIFGPKTQMDYDHSATYSNYKTYSWGDVSLALPQYEQTVRAAVEKNLRSRGWTLVPSGGAATVFASGDVLSAQQLESKYEASGGGWKAPWGDQGWGPGWKKSDYGHMSLVALGTPGAHLVVDIFDTSTHTLLVRAIAEQDMSNTEKKNIKNLGKAIHKMLKKAPKA